MLKKKKEWNILNPKHVGLAGAQVTRYDDENREMMLAFSQALKPHEYSGLTIQFMLLCFYHRDWKETQKVKCMSYIVKANIFVGLN